MKQSCVVRKAHLRSRVCCSYAYATRNMRASSNGRATICAHRGRPILLTLLSAGWVHDFQRDVVTARCEALPHAAFYKRPWLKCTSMSSRRKQPLECTSHGTAAYTSTFRNNTLSLQR